MSHFCDRCANLLEVITTSDKYTFKCNSCHKLTDHSASDTMLYSYETGQYSTGIRHISEDPVNPIVETKCPTCHYNLAKQVRVGQNLNIINGCMKCHNQWVANE